MYAIAIVGDLLGMIPFANIIVDPLTGFALYMVGSGTDEHLFSHRRIGGTIFAAIVKAIPVVSTVAVFSWTLRVYFAKKDAREERRRAAQMAQSRAANDNGAYEGDEAA